MVTGGLVRQVVVCAVVVLTLVYAEHERWSQVWLRSGSAYPVLNVRSPSIAV